MLGLNSLSKLFRKTIGPRIEALGLLPHRYYLHRALDALEEDDIDQAVRMVTLAGNDKKDARWRLVCQQVIFRCRILVSQHEKQLLRFETEMEIFGKPSELTDTYLRLQEAEEQARDILRNYELSLFNQLNGLKSDSVTAE
ncbi:MAG: hypothetical protein PVH35_06070 [Syntrophobacterales bacterium]|jgi:hypothetical protein